MANASLGAASSAAASSTTANIATTTAAPSYPAYIRPSVNPGPGSCDIWGLLCQTGSITVGVNLTSTTTQTVVPCSDYLMAQSYSAYPYPPDQSLAFEASLDYLSSFGRSPECTSYAKAIGGLYQYTTAAYSTMPIQYANCGNVNSSTPLQNLLPPGIESPQESAEEFYCCGPCALSVPALRILYFPDLGASPCAQNYGNSTRTAAPSVPSSFNTIQKRLTSLTADDAGIAVLDGYTYTSPSIYIQVQGTASVHDSCGPLGTVHTSPIIAVPPGVLSTISYPVPIGGTVIPAAGAEQIAYTKVLMISDLACPTWGVESVQPDAFYTVGPPFLPIVVPPPQLLSLDTAWQTCDFLTDGHWIITYGIYDPPYALSAQGVLVPPATGPAPAPASGTPFNTVTQPPAVPVQTPSPGAPPLTTQPSLVIPAQPAPSADPGQHSSSPAQSSPAAPAQNPSNPAQPSGAGPGQDPADPTQSPVNPTQDPADPTPNPPNPTQSVPGPSAPISPNPSQGIGQIIYTAFGASGPNTIPFSAPASAPLNSPVASPPPQPAIFTIAGQALTAVPTGLTVSGSVYTPGGPAATIAGTPVSVGSAGIVIGTATLAQSAEIVTVGGQAITVLGTSALVVGGTTEKALTAGGVTVSLAPSGILVVGTQTVALQQPNVYTVAGQTFTAAPSAVVVDGTSLLPGGAGITVSGTPISLEPSGTLLIGSSAIALPTALPNVYTVGGQIVTAAPSAVVVDGTTLVPGGAGITVSGTPISLEPSGTLLIGSSAIALPTALPNVYTVGGQIVTAAPSAVVVDGTTLLPGGPGITVSRTLISLEPSGTLLIGSSAIGLEPTVKPFEGAQGRMQVPRLGALVGVLGIGFLCIYFG